MILPDERALGPLPSGRSGRPIASFDTTAIGEGIRQFGVAMQKASTVLKTGWEQQDTLAAESELQKFTAAEEDRYNETVRNLLPEQARGFTDSYVKGFKEHADEFARTYLTGLKPEQRMKFDMQLFDVQRKIAAHSIEFEYKAQDAFVKNQIAEQVDNLEIEIRRNGKADFDKLRDQGDERINGSSLPPVAKATLLQSWHRIAARARVLGIAQNDPQAALDEINAWLKPQTPPEGAMADVPVKGFAKGSANAAKPGPVWGTPGAADFESQHLTMIKTPSGASVTVNKVAAAAFTGFLADLEAAGYKIKDVQGYNDRSKLAGGPSQHAFGNAIDINPDQNPAKGGQYGGEPILQTDLPANVGDIAAKWGITWGGDWKSLKDPMHFEYAGATSTIVDSSSSSLAALSAKDIDELSGDIQKMINQQRAEENRIAAQGREDIAKTGDQLMRNDPGNVNYDPSKPSLTMDWLNANRENLSEGDYGKFLTALTPAADSAIHEDPKNLLTLDDKVQADPQQALTDLRDQFANRQITRGTYDQLTARAHGIINGLEKRLFVLPIRTDLSTYLQGSVPGGAGGRGPTQNELSKIREALFVFDDWVVKNPDANRTQVETFSNDLSRNYQTYVALYRQANLPMPKYLSGVARNVITANTLRGAKGRLAADIAAGRISDAEGGDEQQLIIQWEDVVQRLLNLPSGYKTLP